MPFAVVENNTITDLFPSRPDLHASIEVVEVASDVERGWKRSGANKSFAVPTVSLSLEDYNYYLRGVCENGDVEVAGARVSTNPTNVARLTAAYNLTQADKSLTVAWSVWDPVSKTSVQVNLGADQVKALAMAAGVRVQDVFRIYGEVSAGIQGRTIRTVDQIRDAYKAVLPADFEG